MEGQTESTGAGPGKYARAKRIAVVGAALVAVVYVGALAAFPILGRRTFPTGDFSLLITLPPWETDKFWYRTFGGRNVEVRSADELADALAGRIRRNREKYGDSWRFDRIFVVSHGGPGYLIFKLGASTFNVDDVGAFAAVRDFADADSEIVIRCCSMLKEDRGFVFVRALAKTANCKVRAWTDSGMYNGLVQLGDEYLVHPDGRIEKMEYRF